MGLVAAVATAMLTMTSGTAYDNIFFLASCNWTFENYGDRKGWVCCHELNQLDWALTFLGWFLNVKTGKIIFFVLDFILYVFASEC